MDESYETIKNLKLQTLLH